ncbi:SagB/ThcOx family dehydrogenase [Thioalkalivibrio thiocyanodenitrificans]|uniref:SagB/ThcOx family dehydrogenase n=1 Tax=Thioalkalivibrio thiocyanodenitrificans TaxID=243063 RepID=UPI00037D91CB|nr:SagB/ThcOx family dehydrogenase [Thioalkalivibrio thiocyanodenitrificans]
MPIPAARIRAYHEVTKHHPRQYAPGPGRLDWINQPDPFRRFQGAPAVRLPLAADSLTTGYADLYRPGAVPACPLDGEHVAILLELSLGLSAWKSHGGSTWALRCNPSSGNLHPTEGYVVCPALPGLDDGVWHYVAESHTLERRARPGAPGWSARFPAGGVLVGLSSIHWREAWKYGARAYRYCQHDAGHAMAAVRYAAAALGWQARLLDGWDDDALAALLGLDREADFEDAEDEAPDALLWVGPGRAAPLPGDLLPGLADACWQGRANRLSASHVHWSQIAAAEAAALKLEPGANARRAPPARPPLAAPAGNPNAAGLIRQRRSAVAFDGVTGLSSDAFYRMLDTLLPREGTAPWDMLPWAPRVHPVLFVHRVDGIAPGLYVLAREDAALPALRRAMREEWLWHPVPGCPAHIPLRLLASLDVRDSAQLICCHQEIAADSAFAVGMLAAFGVALEAAPWWYRRLHWEAGVLGQVLYLEAEAAGVRATGIGCFFDDEMHRLLGLRDDAWQTVYHFTVGGAVDDPRLSTLPPYAHLDPGNSR